MAEKKVFVVPEKFLIDIILASYDINDKSDEPIVAEEILKITSIFAVQLIAPDENFDLGNLLVKRAEEINQSILNKEPLLGYAKQV